MKNKFFYVFLLLFIFKPHAFAGGTVVGNGGDPVFEFLEAARFSMIESLKVLVNDPNEQAHFCEKNSLSPEQTNFCRQYFLTMVSDILKMNQGKDKTLFVLREEPLKVVGPDGKPMMVAARTDLGPNGPIEFHRDSVKTLLPTQVLFLITHEFQHKSYFNGSFITDNDPIGPFVIGRDLIDSAAESIVALARRNGKVGTQFGIRDIFDCIANTGVSQLGARISSSRLFQNSDLMTYNTSFSKNPTDGSIFLPETNDSSLILRFDISEPNNCGDPNLLRNTKVQIIRSIRFVDGSIQENIISEKRMASNPMCPNTDPKIEISSDLVSFSCRYFGSQGTTSNSTKK
ncbi:MAG: hypothetical protein H7235_06310 [Bdellovibrionaceae bacterium]|nr:hypothetical protein [Pseudobdellovibrionaceae bacterium]